MTTRISTITFLMSFDNCLRFPAMMKISEIADTLNIHRGKVSDVVVRFKRRGSVENKPHTGRHRLLDESDTMGLGILLDTKNAELFL
jgi:DNA-binding IclR family transcriptional regulator